MKRWILLIVLVVGLSSAAVGIQGISSPEAKYLELKGTGAAPTGPTAKLVFVEGGETTYNFGTMPQRETGKHTWKVRNEGQGKLELRMESSTCSCTLAKFKNGEKAVVEPGETTDIDLEFETRENNGAYSKGATIATNDPDLPTFALQVRGEVFPPVMTYPADATLNFSTISNDTDDHTGFVAVYSRDRPDTKILKVTTSSKNVTADFAPLTADDVKALKVPKGEKVTLHVNTDGLALGFFKEEFVIETDHPKQPQVRGSIGGRLTGAIGLMPNTVVMHQADGTLGSSSDLMLVVQNARPTKFEIVKKPENLDVSIQPTDKEGRYKLTVKVPPNTKAAKIVEEIELKTDHPKAGTVLVPVSIWILGKR